MALGKWGGEQEKRHHSSSPRVPTLLLHAAAQALAGTLVQQYNRWQERQSWRPGRRKSTVTAECPALPLLRGQSASVRPCQFPRRGQMCRKWGRKAAGAYLSPFPRSFLKSPRDSRAGGCWQRDAAIGRPSVTAWGDGALDFLRLPNSQCVTLGVWELQEEQGGGESLQFRGCHIWECEGGEKWGGITQVTQHRAQACGPRFDPGYLKCKK